MRDRLEASRGLLRGHGRSTPVSIFWGWSPKYASLILKNDHSLLSRRQAPLPLPNLSPLRLLSAGGRTAKFVGAGVTANGNAVLFLHSLPQARARSHAPAPPPAEAAPPCVPAAAGSVSIAARSPSSFFTRSRRSLNTGSSS